MTDLVVPQPADPNRKGPPMLDNLIFLILNSVPMRFRGRLYLRICRRQMERWHPRLRTDPSWLERWQ